MSKKVLILIVVALVILGIAAYFLFFRESSKTTEVVIPPPSNYTTPPKVTPKGNNPVTGGVGTGGGATVPPTPPPPPTVQAAVVGQKAVAIRRTRMYNGSGLVTGYSAGGSDDTGYINNGYYVGVVKEINLAYKSAKVENYTTPAVTVNWLSDNTTHTSFWVSLNDIKKG